MVALPAHRFIPDIREDKGQRDRGQGQGPAPAAKAMDLGEALIAHGAKRPPVKLEDAYARGYDAGRAAALAELQDKLKQQQDHYAHQLSLERYTWASRESEILAAQIGDGLKEIEARIANTVARLLRPFFGEIARAQAVEELVDALEVLLGADEGMRLEVSGPEDLLEMLRGKLGGRNVAVLFAPGEGAEVRVSAGQTLLETNLGQWMKRVEERIK
jgi:hypothetical protein